MKYTAEERLDIGRRIYNGEITRYEAAVQYGLFRKTRFAFANNCTMIRTSTFIAWQK